MKRPLTALAALLCATTLLSAPSTATAKPPGGPPEPRPAGSTEKATAPTHPDRVPDPDARLGAGWRRSTDRAVTTSSDATGLHLLVADEAQAYAWRTAATLAEPGLDADQWIGQACVTGSGRRAVVVYGPRTFTNREPLMQRGGTRQAKYVVRRPNGTTEHRTIPTQWEANKWVNLGVFDFTGSGTPKVELSNFTLDGTGVQDIAWDAIAVQPLPSKPRHFVVALGDSYSSGEGSGAYTRVSDQYGDDAANRNSCRRSPNAWSQKATIPGAPGTIGSLAAGHNVTIDAQFVACSGARAHNVMSPDLVTDGKWQGTRVEGQYGEISQIDQGSLNANTTAVMFSIGGNDARFTKVGDSCAKGFDCSAPDYVMEGDNKPLGEKQTELINGVVKDSVREVVRQVRVRAPNARIFVMGYPHLFEPGCQYAITLPPAFTVGLSTNETAFLNSLADQMAAILPSDAANKVHGMDARSEFGGHGICAASTEYLNGFVVPDLQEDEDGDPVQASSMETLHPNQDGYLAYARILNNYMSLYGYNW
ncbi:SGNH/GDSL hydrolase family protein [Micromonospora sp. PTRAS2]